MQKFEDLPPVDKKGLRSFGLTMGIVIAGLFGLFFPWVFERAWPLWPFVVGGIFAVWGLALPMTLKRVYNGWMRFGLALSRITTPIIMGIVFYLLFTPMAIARISQRSVELHEGQKEVLAGPDRGGHAAAGWVDRVCAGLCGGAVYLYVVLGLGRQ
jgi:hypothetical protein